MATDVLMPQMGESIAEGTIVKWLKKVGDSVQRDEPLFEISTDKVDAEVPSTVAGVLTEIIAKEGDTVAVNSVVARVGESDGASSTPAAPEKPAEAPAAPPTAASKPAAPPAKPAPAPVAQAPAPPTPAKAPIVAPPAQALPAPAADAEARRARSSPLVRNIARENDVDLEAIAGTGNGGRITKEDILNFIAQRKTTAVAGAAAAPAPAPASPAPRVFAPGERVHIEPMSIMRAHGAQPANVSSRHHLLRSRLHQYREASRSSQKVL